MESSEKAMNPSASETIPSTRIPLATFDTDASSSSSCDKFTSPSLISPSRTTIETPTYPIDALVSLQKAPVATENVVSEQVASPQDPHRTTNSPSIYSVPELQQSPDQGGVSPPNTPNQGSVYIYVIVFCAFMINFILEGQQFGIGIIAENLKKEFNSNMSETGWIAGMFLAMPHLAAPVASFLVNKYGCKKITILGSLLAALGVGMSSMGNSLTEVFILYGVIGGFGFSLVDVATNAILAQYCIEKLSLMSGIAVCGGGIGMLVLLPFIQLFMEKFGWRYTNALCGITFLSIIPCALLFRPLQTKTNSQIVSANSGRAVIPVALNRTDTRLNRLVRTLKSAVGAILDPVSYRGFVIFAISNFIFFVFNDIPFLYPLYEKPWLVGVIGIVNALGQVILGWLGDSTCIKNDILYAAVISVCGLTIVLMPFSKASILALSLVNAIFGLSIAVNYALTNIILREQLYNHLTVKISTMEGNVTKKEKEIIDRKFNNSYGLLLFTQGVGNLIGPPLAGWFVDMKEIDLMYYITGLSIILSGIMMMCLPIIDYLKKETTTTETTESSNEAIQENDTYI